MVCGVLKKEDNKCGFFFRVGVKEFMGLGVEDCFGDFFRVI